MLRPHRPSLRVPFSVVLAALALACGGGDSRPTTPVDPPAQPTPPAVPATLTLARDTATILVDDTVSLVATARAASGAPIDAPTVAWTTSAAEVATVDASGHVRGMRPGTATISASAGTAAARATVTIVPQFVRLSTGTDHACGISSTARLYCWGSDTRDQLGAPPGACPGAAGSCSAVPVAVGDSLRFARVAAGTYHTCALTTDGRAYCWGDNSSGQVGAATTTELYDRPTAVAGGHVFTSIAAGGLHSCGTTADGETWCWGSDLYGTLGATPGADRCTSGTVTGTYACSHTPVLAVATPRLVSLSLTPRATCGLSDGGAALCWGATTTGGCPTDPSTSACQRTPVSLGGPYVSLAASDQYQCARSADGTLRCTGSNAWGTFGNGNTTSSTEMVLAAGGASFASVVSGATHVCALDAVGAVSCWGRNSLGQVGDVATPVAHNRPYSVAGAPFLDELVSSAQSDFTCGLAKDGHAYCWGSGGRGQLGNGTLTQVSPQPQAVRLF